MVVVVVVVVVVLMMMTMLMMMLTPTATMTPMVINRNTEMSRVTNVRIQLMMSHT